MRMNGRLAGITRRMRSHRLLLALLVLGGCNAPDYTPVRDWAATASLAVDFPRIAGSTVVPPPGAESALPASQPDGSIVAMQEALATYLQAVATLASDGVLPYRESPFVELAARVAPVSPSAATPSPRSACCCATPIGPMRRRRCCGTISRPPIRRCRC